MVIFFLSSSKLPESVFTKNKSGKIEVRVLESRGEYVIYNYVDPETWKPVENGKKKICLKAEDGETHEFFMIPMKDHGRFLALLDKGDEKERKIWNSVEKRDERLWKD